MLDRLRHSAWVEAAFIVLMIAFLSIPVKAFAAPNDAVVLYPVTLPPARDLYAAIRTSLKKELESQNIRVVERGVESTKDDASTLRLWVSAQKPRAVITLNRYTYDVVSPLAEETPIVAGGVRLDSPVPNVSIVSLSAHPRLMMQRILQMVPGSKRIITVANPRSNGSYLQAAETAARSARLIFTNYDASTLRDATQHLANVVSYGNPQTDVLWLLDDATLIDPEVTLSPLLELAWSKGFVVISSSLDHVRKGALVGVYLNPSALGKRLGQLATTTSSRSTGTFTFGEDVLFALNARTALHLGIDPNARLKSNFGMIFGDL